MVWRTIVLCAVNIITMFTVFLPIVTIPTVGFEDKYYLHGGKGCFFWIQAALGIYAVIVDMLSKKEKLYAKLITAGVALSLVFAGIVLWLSFTFDGTGDLSYDSAVGAGAWVPILNVVLFGVVWIDQRRRAVNK